MKCASVAAIVLAFAFSAFAQTLESVSYNLIYDNPAVPLTYLACSDGPYGLMSKGYTNLGSLPTYPYVGGVYSVTGWDSPACGSCYKIRYGPTDTTITVLAVDVAPNGFIINQYAMNVLTGGLAIELGSVEVDMIVVEPVDCGIPE